MELMLFIQFIRSHGIVPTNAVSSYEVNNLVHPP